MPEEKLSGASSTKFFNQYEGVETYKLDLPILPETPEDYAQAFRKNYPKSVQTKPPAVYEIENTTIISSYGIPVCEYGYLPETGLSSKNILIGLLSAGTNGITPSGRSAFQKKKEFDTLLSLVGPYDKNYYHWFGNYLPRLEGLQHYPGADEVTLMIPADPPEWLRDSLELLGFGDYNIVEWPGKPVHADRYILSRYRSEASSETGNRPPIMSKKNFKWILDRIGENTPNNTREKDRPRIYISREDATARRTLNEQEVMATLSEYDFEKYILSEYSLAEQIRLFSNAEIIIGAHGAGLINMLFASDATVIELLGPKTSSINPGLFYTISQPLNHTYACMDVETVHRDIHVNTEKLKKLLNKV
ncbi:glycosyltransferase family 61 protein [Natrinema pellirubrum]|uniref:glycosyltransferase family 61 protein n=1 Tax=Natrinema pellirubrum TaxID=69525 RepID=UPI0012FC1BEA|nr:glycosyltransferase family 61 protein [Natrinema pellirubrum]